MKILSLNCNKCGAPLDVPRKAKYVTCGFCDSRLAIQHSGNTYSTEVIEQLVQTTSAIQDELADLKRRAAITDLDQDWERKKRSYVVKGDDGSESLPSIFGIVVHGVIGTVMTLFALTIFPPIGLLFMLLIGGSFVSSVVKHSRYQMAQERYRSQRRRLMYSSGTGRRD